MFLSYRFKQTEAYLEWYVDCNLDNPESRTEQGEERDRDGTAHVSEVEG